MHQLAHRAAVVVLALMVTAQLFNSVAFAAGGGGPGSGNSGSGSGNSGPGGGNSGPSGLDNRQVRSGSGDRGGGSSSGGPGDVFSGSGGSSGGPSASSYVSSGGGGGGSFAVSASLDGVVRGAEARRSGSAADRGQPRLLVNFNDRF